MGDIALRGPELVKMVALAKKRDLNFAYCPGNDPKEDIFVLDIKRNPEILGRIARGEGTGAKVGFGTARVKSRVMFLSCERELSQMDKKLKKFLIFEKIAMNIVVLDADGNALEQNAEDVGDNEDAMSPPADAGSDQALNKLRDVSAALSKRIDGVDDADKLRAAHSMLEEQIAAGDVKMATGTAKALGDAILRADR